MSGGARIAVRIAHFTASASPAVMMASNPHTATSHAKEVNYERAGIMSNFGIAGSVHAHGCADFTQQSICGLNQLWSSRLADLMDIATPRNASLSAKSGPRRRHRIPGARCFRSRPLTRTSEAPRRW